jgi:peptide deformylase
MILPIVAYGDSVLRKVGRDIQPDFPELKQLIDDMFETMYAAPGVGLAAQQIGKDIKLFVVDSAYALKKEEPTEEHEAPADVDDKEKDEFEGETGIKKTFINAKMIKELGKKWVYNEGCLSIPGVREDIERLDTIIIEYYYENFNKYTEEFHGFTARVIQHEYDHTHGILFTDRLNPIKKRFLKNKLENISKGLVDVKYKMKFPAKQKSR